MGDTQQKHRLNIVNRDEFPTFEPSPKSVYRTKRKVKSVKLKMISHDEVYKKQKAKGTQIDIINPEIYVNNKKPIDGIFSPLFGADTTQDTPVYTCECRKLVGGTNRGRICPECGTECRSIEADLRICGYIDIAPYHIMTYHGYNAMSSIIKNLKEVISTVKKINIRGKIVDDGVYTIMDLYDEYDEKFYPITGIEKKYAFTSKIPVFTSRLRPLMRMGSNMTILDVNKWYLSIVKSRNILNSSMIIHLNPKIEIQRTLNQIQQDFNEICSHVVLQNSGKSGVFRRMLAAGRVDYSSRMVISLGTDLKPHEVDIPYQTAMVIYEEEIVNYLSRLENISISKAISSYLEAQNHRDDRFVRVINQLLKQGSGVWALINRNPTINESGILYVRVRGIHDDTNDYTLHLPPDILPLLGADLTKVAFLVEVRYGSNSIQEQFGERLTNGVHMNSYGLTVKVI